MNPLKFIPRPMVKLWLAREWLFFRRWIVCLFIVPLACLVVFLFNGMKADDPAIKTTAAIVLWLWLFVYFVRLLLQAARAGAKTAERANKWSKATVSGKGVPSKPKPENLPPFGKN